MVRAGLVLCAVLLASALVGQEQPDSPAESIEFDVPAESPTESDVRSPTVALTLSAILPGAGQIYNGSYWKTPIILGFGGYFVYAIVVLHDYYIDYRQRFRDSITEENPTGSNQLRRIRDFYRDQRDRFAWYSGFLYLINLLDAYVEATLSGFDVGEDLSVRLTPYMDHNGSTGLQLHIRF
jgi:TM2 domain-containing membrane protein YozV